MKKITHKVSRKDLQTEVETLKGQLESKNTEIKKISEDLQREHELNKKLIAEKTPDICKYLIDCDIANSNCIGQTELRTHCKIIKQFEQINEKVKI